MMMRATVTAIAAMAMAMATTATSPAVPVQADPAKIGPPVGKRLALAGGRLRDASGKPTTLAAIGGGRPMMLVLFRSAKWCPYCQRQLIDLAPVADAARARRIGFAAISYDEPETLAAFAVKQRISYPLFSDAGGRMFAAIRLRDPRYAAGNFAYGVPYPTVLAIAANGTVVARSIETDYKLRPSNRDLMAMLSRL